MNERIIISIPAFARGKGGAERTAATVAALLRKQGHSVAIVCNKRFNSAPSYPVPEGVDLIACDYFSRVPQKRNVAISQVAEFDPTIAILFYADASLYKQLFFFKQFEGLVLLAQECTNPVRAVRNFRRTYGAQVSIFQAFWLRQAALFQLDAIRFTIPGYVSSVLPALRSRARGFYNAFHFEQFPQPSQVGRRKIICVGGLKDLNKNGLVVAEAFGAIAHHHPGWSLHFFGVDRFSDKLQQIISRHGLEGRVVSHGIVGGADTIYTNAAISVVASFEEGNPNVVNEAMAYGAITLGYADCQGVKHLVDHRETGFLVGRNHEVEELAAGMECLIASPELRETIEANARALVLQRCDHDAYVANWLDILDLARQRHDAGAKSDQTIAAMARYFDIGLDAFRRSAERIYLAAPTESKSTGMVRLYRKASSFFERKFVRSPRERIGRLGWKDQRRSFRFFKLWATSFFQLSGRFGAYDLVILHDTLGALAALWLAGWRRSRIILDVSETPNLRNRTTPLFARSWLPFHWLYQATAAWVGRGAKQVLLQSPDLKDVARQHFRREGAVWVHTRTPDQLPPGRERQATIVRNNPKILVAWPSDFSEATGAALAPELLDAMAAEITMIFIGSQVPAHKQQEILARYGDSVKFHPRTSELEYLALLEGCDIAIVLFNPDLENTRLCLPNRFLDCMQVGVPVVSTPHPGVEKVLQMYPDQGIMTQSRNIEDLRTAMLRARCLRAERLDRIQLNSALSGMSMEDLVSLVSTPANGRIAVVAQRDVTDRPRFRELVRLAEQSGCIVDAFSRAKPRRWVINSKGRE